ncbi:MAG: hypothetical protein MKZ70_01935 [Opitutales bacterium]|nr:hypothetical protein [Opitutales bacterium]MCH2613440.1 hypothetical protein [Opitutales bacterium]|tara:strand:- start:159 stop:332 length:174 start_codon:yes stop_codon:yes gene_type:complete
MAFPTKQFKVLAIAVLAFFLPATIAAKESNPPPNIVFFLVDDLGWTDINSWEGPDGQ